MTSPVSWPAPAAAPHAPPRPYVATRATITLLFTDICGSTRQWERLPHMAARVEQHFDVLRAAIAANGGTVFATMGDGIAAVFVSATAAINAAAEAQRALTPLDLEVRMGLHTGEVDCVGTDVRGRSVNRAARIMSAAHGGQILLSEVTAAIVRGSSDPVRLLDLGLHALRDLAEPERLWQLCGPGLRERFPTVNSVSPSVANLPVPRTSLVGRRDDVWRVRHAASRSRIVTVTGPGGIGKSRVANRAAAELAGDDVSVWFADLSVVSRDEDVPDVIEAAVAALPGVPAGAIGDRSPALLVIDNCEHVVAVVAGTVDRLLSRHPGLGVIVTSREPLALDGERVVTLHPLELDAAVELFRGRAESAGADLQAVAPAEIERVCRRLEGVPLAIELAAARAATLGVPGGLDVLAGRAARLSARRVDGGGRHRTLQATIEWSYRLLDPAEQRLLRWLSVFRSGFELDAVTELAARAGALAGGLAGDAGELLGSLAAKSLVTPSVEFSHVRYRMLESVRQFARVELDASGEAESAALAHAEWVATLTGLGPHDPCSAEAERNAVRLEREADNWRAAVHTATERRLADLAARLCGPPTAYFLFGRHDLGDVVRPLLDLCTTPADRRAVLGALVASSSGTADAGELASWVAEIDRVEQDDPTGLGVLMGWMTLAWSGDFTTSVELCAAGSIDTRYRPETRDLLLGIAILDHFSLTGATDDRHGLVPRAAVAAERSAMALTRATCLLGMAWAAAPAEPDRALALVASALAAVPRTPALTRLALPGNASRLLSQLAPEVAARGFLEQLDSRPSRRSFVDLVPLVYAVDFLRRAGRRVPDGPLAHPSAGTSGPTVSMMDFVDLARRASQLGSPVAVSRLEAAVRTELERIAGAAAPST